MESARGIFIGAMCTTLKTRKNTYHFCVAAGTIPEMYLRRITEKGQDPKWTFSPCAHQSPEIIDNEAIWEINMTGYWLLLIFVGIFFLLPGKENDWDDWLDEQKKRMDEDEELFHNDEM